MCGHASRNYTQLGRYHLARVTVMAVTQSLKKRYMRKSTRFAKYNVPIYSFTVARDANQIHAN